MKTILLRITLGLLLLLCHSASIYFSYSFVELLLTRFQAQTIAMTVFVLVLLEAGKHLNLLMYCEGALLGKKSVAQNFFTALFTALFFLASYLFATQGAIHQAQSTTLKTTEIEVNKAQQEAQIKKEYNTLIQEEKAKLAALDSLKASRFSWIGLDSLEKIAYAHTLTRIQAYEQERTQALTRLHAEAHTRTHDNKAITAQVSAFQFYFSLIIEALTALFTFGFYFFHRLPEIVKYLTDYFTPKKSDNPTTPILSPIHSEQYETNRSVQINDSNVFFAQNQQFNNNHTKNSNTEQTDYSEAVNPSNPKPPYYDIIEPYLLDKTKKYDQKINELRSQITDAKRYYGEAKRYYEMQIN